MTAQTESSLQIQALHWEDADPTANRWWIARARDSSAGVVRDVFIAEDDMTEALVGLLRIPPQSRYRVLAATFLDRFESRAAAAAALKDEMAAALGRDVGARASRRGLLRWRAVRTFTVLRKNVPFLILGLFAGAALGLAVALFSVWTEFVGWPIVAAGIALGGAVGFLLKLAVEFTRAKALAGPWGRFALIMLGAVVGAGLTAAGTMLLFWH